MNNLFSYLSVLKNGIRSPTAIGSFFKPGMNQENFISSPEGRVVKNGSNFEYQYAIADHQGNTRVVFTSATPAAQTVAATFEDNTQTTEQANFQNYPSGGNRSSLDLYDHTDAGTTFTHSQLSQRWLQFPGGAFQKHQSVPWRRDPRRGVRQILEPKHEQQ